MSARPSARVAASRVPFAAAALGVLAGCHGSAEVVLVPVDPVYVEAEPNDDVTTADDFGYLSPGEHVCIEGSVRDDAYDPQDGFAFAATGPILVDFMLDAGCACADLDVWIYDPVRDEFVGFFDSPSSSESGQFTVYGAEFHIVVVSAGGDASYRLDVRASSWYGLSAADVGASGRGPVVGAAGPALELGRAPGPALERYRDPWRATGAPRAVEVYLIDPRAGVVGRGLVTAGS